MKLTKDIRILITVILGVVFLVISLIIAITMPEPTQYQYVVFRTTLALSVSGIAILIPGILNIKVGKFITAGGALAVFVLIYLYNPAELVMKISPYQIDQSELLKQRDTAKEIIEAKTQLYLAGAESLSSFIEANNNLLKIELEMCRKTEDRISIISEALQRAKNIKEKVETLVTIGSVRKVDLSEINSHCDLLNNDILKEKSKLQD